VAVDENICFDHHRFADNSFDGETTAIDFRRHALNYNSRAVNAHRRRPRRRLGSFIFFRQFASLSTHPLAGYRRLGCIAKTEQSGETVEMRNTIVVALLLAAACSDQPQQQGQQSPPPDTAGGRPDLARPDVGKTVAIVVTDTAIQSSHDSIQAVGTGQMSFSVSNQGTATAEVAIEGGDLGRWTSTPVGPGKAVLMSMLMGPGTYEVVWKAGDKTLRRPIRVY
jgi:hypothetical protein